VSCPHSLIGSPDWCSQCRGATVRRVDASGATIDGQPVPKRDQEERHYFVRGGRRKKPRT
jgi:hypothetical protein